VRKLAGSNPALTLEMLRGCTDNLSWMILDKWLIAWLVCIYLGSWLLFKG
jgi:hypothetical protein